MPKYEYWDGSTWQIKASESYVDNKVYNINSGTSGQLNINRLNGYPSNNSVFLRGDGLWSSVSPTISLPYSIYTTSLSSGLFNIYNSNNSATDTSFGVYNQNTLNGTKFGLNSSASDGYLWSNSLTSLSFGTNDSLRMKINSNGSIDCFTNDITTSGNISATTGTLKGNNLASHNSGSVQVLNPLNMQNNNITGLPLIPSGSTSSTSKDYVDKRTDKYQTLSYSSSISWNATNGNIAVLTLTGNSEINSISWNQESTLILYVKQDSIGNRSLNIYGIYRSGSTSSLMPLSTSPNTTDCLIFRWSGESGRLYLTQVINNFQFVPFPSVKYIFDYSGSVQSLIIPSSGNNRCLIKLLGAGGGQGIYSNGQGNSGAGGYLMFEFVTTTYIGQSLFITVGQGGQGGVCSPSGQAGYGGYPNGGGGSSWDTGINGEYSGGGGGRTEVRIGSPTGTIVAIAGGGGGGSGYGSYHAGAGGSNSGNGQNTINGTSFNTGGTLTSGGVSASGSPPGFNQAWFSQGAGFATPAQFNNYTGGGGGDGYYGGGFYASYGGGGGGSSYINYAGIPYSTILPDVSPSNGINISSTASADSDFSGSYGVGRVGAANGSLISGLRGGNGRAVIQFT